jgi:hypothetical protein
VRAMPAKSMGYLMPRRSQSGVCRGGGGGIVMDDICSKGGRYLWDQVQQIKRDGKGNGDSDGLMFVY